jgi:hypothetical protein
LAVLAPARPFALEHAYAQFPVVDAGPGTEAHQAAVEAYVFEEERAFLMDLAEAFGAAAGVGGPEGVEGDLADVAGES